MAAVASLATAAVLAVSVPGSESPRSAGLPDPGGVQTATNQSTSRPTDPLTGPTGSVTPTASAGPGPTSVATAATAATGPFRLARLEPGSVRLPLGGTARLVRRDVGGDGTLPVPDGVAEAAWWGSELTAGTGAAVIAGHVTWRGEPGPFAELWQAGRGGRIEVTDAQGRHRRYRITEVRTVAKSDLPRRAPDLFGQRGPHRIVLVTCGGRWVGGPRGYEANRIVVGHPD
ncbi:class F sortase [Micromonospora tulbaghiae]|uniref:class F sortase n=1 Tax=Micromonospora tulbaghiae TaxID=479978 RepID=UPI003EC062D8